MYDIDPPGPVLRLDAPRKATQPTALTDRQHLARLANADYESAILGVARLVAAGVPLAVAIDHIRRGQKND